MQVELRKPTRQYSLDEYVTLEEKSEVRHEFYNGEVYATAGGTRNHNLLIHTVKDIFKGQLIGKECRILSENMKVKVIQGIKNRQHVLI